MPRRIPYWLPLAAAALLTGATLLLLVGGAFGSGTAKGDPAGSPWSAQPDGAPSLDATQPLGSLVFPAGVTYAEALTRLYVSMLEDGRLPAEAAFAEPLPREVVVVLPADDSVGLRLSLTAPWGWTYDTRLIRAPSYALPGTLSPVEADLQIREAQTAGRALPESARIDVPYLPPCQVAYGTPEARPPC